MTTSDHRVADSAINMMRGCGQRGRWTGMNIAGMVLGFILFWPVGLVILGWIMSGRDVRELFNLAREKAGSLMPFRGSGDRNSVFVADVDDFSDNEVFNEYQQTQHDRIHEIKEEISERARRFGEYRSAARRRAEREEFDRFMNDAPMSS